MPVRSAYNPYDQVMDDVMTAAVLVRHGDAEAIEVHDDWPVPVPGEGQLRLRVSAAAINNTDIWTRQGAYGTSEDPDAQSGWCGPIDFPRIQGADVVGVVDAVGPGVSEELIGRRVLVDPAIYRDNEPDAPVVAVVGSELDGGFAQYLTISHSQMHDVTDSPLSDEELASLPIAYGTALGMLERAEGTAGETVLVSGASGGVGLALVQLAAARGCRVIAVSSADRADLVREAGAAVVCCRDLGELAEQISDAAPEGLHLVADVVGGGLLAEVMPLLRAGGRWVIAGAVAGPVIQFDLRRLYLHNLRLIGSTMHTRDLFAKLVTIANEGQVAPRIAATHPLREIRQAQAEFLSHDHVGKIVLLP